MAKLSIGIDGKDESVDLNTAFQFPRHQTS